VEDRKSAEYRRIFMVFVALAVLTIVEYVVGLAFPSPAILLILALTKTVLIVNFFMHVYRLWREEAH
jgi:caa(3)-type oxidase subunit IV